MLSDHSSRPVFGQPGWRRRMENHYGWDKEFMAIGIVLILVLLVSLGLAHGDDQTGLPQGDPKDLSPEQMEAPCSTGQFFLPIPSWSHFAKMPPLPDQLKPMGKGPANTATPSSAAIAETKPDSPPMPKKLSPTKANTTAAPDPALIAVSPFLQWIKDHPQEAATQARKESGSYAGPPANVPLGPEPYWMPPLIDASDSAPAPAVGGSAAIYTTPQK